MLFIGEASKLPLADVDYFHTKVYVHEFDVVKTVEV